MGLGRGGVWIELSWRIDPRGTWVRKHRVPVQNGKKVSVEEYYRWRFENSVPAFSDKAANEGISPLES